MSYLTLPWELFVHEYTKRGEDTPTQQLLTDNRKEIRIPVGGGAHRIVRNGAWDKHLDMIRMHALGPISPLKN